MSLEYDFYFIYVLSIVIDSIVKTVPTALGY